MCNLVIRLDYFYFI
uniref:Uncharacterized protein n=1 Tax=Anguilla anguilla TaxID=7936 RepID=A0A0E9SDT3_ANGAN